MSFLHVITRCYRRPNMLMANLASMMQQTDGDYEQTLLVDTVGRGMGYAQAQLTDYAPHLRGEYVWLLDDDDLCVWPEMVSELKQKVAGARKQPDVIMVRMQHGGSLGVQPDGAHWGKPPVLQHVGCSAYLVRRDWWQVHAHAWATAHYNSDYDFIEAVWDSNPSVLWVDRIASACQRISHGEPE